MGNVQVMTEKHNAMLSRTGNNLLPKPPTFNLCRIEQIVMAWELIAKTYVPRKLTTEERHQFEMAVLIEQQEKEKSFVLP